MQANCSVPEFILTSFLECPQSPHHIPEEPKCHKKCPFPQLLGNAHLASLLRSLKETPVAVGSSSAVLPSTSHELRVDILVTDPLFYCYKNKCFKSQDYSWQTLIQRDLGWDLSSLEHLITVSHKSCKVSPSPGAQP